MHALRKKPKTRPPTEAATRKAPPKQPKWCVMKRDEEGPHPAEAIGSDLDALSALPPTQGAKITTARQKRKAPVGRPGLKVGICRMHSHVNTDVHRKQWGDSENDLL